MPAQNDHTKGDREPYPQWFQYVVPQPEDTKWGLVVTAAGTTSIPPGGEYPPSNHPESHYFRWEDGRVLGEYGLIFVTGGRGTLETANCGTQPIDEGNLFILYPGIWHRYRPDAKTGWEECWINLQGPLARQILAPPFFSADTPVLNTGVNAELLAAFLKVAEVVQNLTPGRRPSLAATTMDILAKLYDLRHGSLQERTPAEKTAEKARAYMIEHHAKEIDHQQLAATLGVSYSTYRRIFKRHTGTSPNQYLIHIRLEHAKDQLLHTHKSIHQIAAEAGFSSAEYFARLFRQKFEQAPSDLRDW